MSTRSQKRRSIQERNEHVGESIVSPIVTEIDGSVDQDVLAAGPPRSIIPRIENKSLESLSASLMEERTSEIKNLLAESQRELLKLLKPKTVESINEEEEISLKVKREAFTPRLNLSVNQKKCFSK